MNTITTAAELDALPIGSIVKVCDGLEMPASFWLNGKGGLWWTFAATHGYSSAEMAEGWAFAVLYRPDRQPAAQPTVEQVALTIYEATMSLARDGVRADPWENLAPYYKRLYETDARAVLALFAEPGR